jgi:hypothetical protein
MRRNVCEISKQGRCKHTLIDIRNIRIVFVVIWSNGATKKLAPGHLFGLFHVGIHESIVIICFFVGYLVSSFENDALATIKKEKKMGDEIKEYELKDIWYISFNCDLQ